MNYLVRYLHVSYWALAFALSVGLATRATHAQQQRTIAGQKIIAAASFSGYQALLNDVDFVGTLAEKPALRDMFEGFVSMATGGNGIEGINRTQPWGAVLYGNDFQFLAFIPADEPESVMVSLRAAAQGNLSEVQDGVYLWEQKGKSFFLTAKDRYVWIATDPQQFDSAPVNPRQALGDLPLQYDIAVRLYVQAIPQPVRQMFFTGFESGLTNVTRDVLSADEAAGQAVKSQVAELRRTINDLDFVTVGWNLDESRGHGELELAYAAKPGSSLLESARKLQLRPSRFAGFALPQATFSSNLTFSVDETDSAQFKLGLDRLRDGALEAIAEDVSFKNERKRELAREAINALFAEVNAVIQQGSIDFVGSLIAKPSKVNVASRSGLRFDKLTVVAACEIANERRIEQILRKLVDQQSENFVTQWNAFTHDGIRFHRFQVPVDGKERRTFGATLDIFVGFGDRSCYFGAGNRAKRSLIAAINQSRNQASTKFAPARFSFSVTDCILSSQSERPFAQLHELWQEFTQDDKVHVTLLPTDNGGRLLVRFEPGVVHGFCRSIGQGIDQGMPLQRGL